MNHHPDVHRYLHAARATDLHAQAHAWKVRWTAGANHSGRSSMRVVRARFGWLLVETGLRLLQPPAPPRPTEG
ncbi:hypothetical protein GCM10022420_094800 [Streptomyces iranensis]|uniref:Uncharacterized protein n=1 Tax=Streptomyces iranensis TaxID=576784 RepID=A0ABS4N6J6_9ACTN|nr:hypothetical protein [Streptomyces iranensis]